MTRKGRARPKAAARADNKPKTSPAAAGGAKPKQEGLSQEQIARRAGCSQSTVSRAIARGDIETLSNGRLPESAIPTLRELRQHDELISAETEALERRLLAAQAGEREAKMRLRELELERESGRFVELASVERAGADAALRILSVLRAMPQRIALAVDGALAAPADRRAATVEKIIAIEVERAITELRESLYLQVQESTGDEPEPNEGGAE